jgi:glycosyltransferase involved in cell wall biosynthesis
MIKLVHIIGRLAGGGAEKLLLDLCRKIDKESFDVTVFVIQEDNPLQQQFEDAGIKLKFFGKKGKTDFSVIKRMAEQLKVLKPEIVHTHLFEADYFGGKAAKLAKVPKLVSTKHDILSEGFLRNYLGHRARQKFDKVIAISSATRDWLMEKEQMPFDMIELIYNGVDPSRFYNEEKEILKNEKIIIGSVGRLAKEKGHKHLIRACRFLRNVDWNLILVGDGPLLNELKTLTQFLGIEDKVKFTGFVEDVRPYLEQMDVFVLPSVSEGLSLSILEAALSGKFIIATDVGGIPEIIKNKETGLLFTPKNIEQLVLHLNWVNDHRSEAQKMAKRLQREVLEKFDINQVVRRYENFYRDLVK